MPSKSRHSSKGKIMTDTSRFYGPMGKGWWDALGMVMESAAKEHNISPLARYSMNAVMTDTAIVIKCGDRELGRIDLPPSDPVLTAAVGQMATNARDNIEKAVWDACS